VCVCVCVCNCLCLCLCLCLRLYRVSSVCIYVGVSACAISANMMDIPGSRLTLCAWMDGGVAPAAADQSGARCRAIFLKKQEIMRYNGCHQEKME